MAGNDIIDITRQCPRCRAAVSPTGKPTNYSIMPDPDGTQPHHYVETYDQAYQCPACGYTYTVQDGPWPINCIMYT